MVEVMIGFGSNLGNRRKNIIDAIKKMSEGIDIIKISKIYRTQPQENVSGEWFLNGVVCGKTSMKPGVLLQFLQSIEQTMGRPKNHKKNTARTIDLDILFYGNRIIKKKNLIVPHPKIAKRGFVLKGLVQISPDFLHPELKKTIKQLWEEFQNGNIKKEKPGKGTGKQRKK